MNVYDFDNTISHGDSTVAFIRYCIGLHPKVLLTMPGTGVAALGMAMGIISKTRFKEYMFRFLRHIPNVQQAVEDFWDSGRCSIHQWYLDAHQEDDLVISASPEFLLQPICRRLGISNLIASRVDPRTGRYSGPNCHGINKVSRYREVYGDTVPQAFYSDSYKDEPMARIAAQAYMVRGENVCSWIFRQRRSNP